MDGKSQKIPKAGRGHFNSAHRPAWAFSVRQRWRFIAIHTMLVSVHYPEPEGLFCPFLVLPLLVRLISAVSPVVPNLAASRSVSNLKRL